MTQSTQHNPVRVGVIGAGWPGERHGEGYVTSGEGVIVAVSDLDAKRREDFAEAYGAQKVYSDYGELLADPEIEAVSIALPNFLHKPVALAALEAGKHVLCEKPPAVTYADAQAMEQAAQERGLILAFALQRRFNPSMDALRARMAEGALGEVYHARAVWTRTWGVPQGMGAWFTDPARAGGGALIDIGIHVFDLAWYLMGCPAPTTVSGQVYNKFPEQTRTDDSAFALIRFADGRSLQLEASWVLTQEHDQMGVSLFGTQAGAHVDDRNLTLIPGNGMESKREMFSFPGGQVAFTAQSANFARAIRGKEQVRTPASQGTQLMAVIDAIYRSSAEGREVTL